VQFAFLAIPLSVLVFALVDVGRISLQRRQMQDALDAATLMAARSTATTDAELEAVGDPAFVAEVAGLNMGLTTSNANFKNGTDNHVIGTATATLKPIIANLWKSGDFTVVASSDVVRSSKNLEVAVVLDITGSMGGTHWYGQPTYYTANNNWITDDKSSSTNWFTRQGEPAKYAANNKSKITNAAKTGTDDGPNAGCGITNVLRMTNVRTSAGATTVKNKLDQMVATGNTNVAMGMVWGWHMISPNAPFADGSAYGTKNISKVIVLLTDGDNVMGETSDPNDSTYSGYGYIWQKRLKNASNVALDVGATGDERRDAMDSRLSKTCTNAKASGKNVIIYAIGGSPSNGAPSSQMKKPRRAIGGALFVSDRRGR
jgi:Flp pilus assembly protein TadG